jgi:molybdenum cofactor guanylyltransferase
MEKECLSVLVLAGGESRRMGRDKALIKIGGVPLLRRTCEIGLICGRSVYVVTPRVEDYRSLVPADCEFIHESRSPNASPPGPLVGFACGLAQVHTNWVLLLACDLPLLDANVLQRWAQQIDHVDGEIALLVDSRPLSDSSPLSPSAFCPLPPALKIWEPLCGFYRRSCLERLNGFIRQGGQSFQRWLAQESVRAIALSDNSTERDREWEMLLNCNTLEDIKKVDSYTDSNP